MHFVYVLLSLKGGVFCTDYAHGLKLWVEKYNLGKVRATRNWKLLKLYSFKECLNT